ESLRIEPGDVYMILCAFVFSVQILLIDHFSRRVDGVAMSCVQFFTMTVISALGAAVTAETVSAEALRVCLWAILYAGIFSSGVAYTLQILAQKDSNPMVVSLLLSLESVFAALSGALFRHERMTARELLGCALMFAAVLIAQIPRDALESGNKQ
ncbi:MAG: DMT family transporter, partial [Oscillibacter sp.]|nr:DMT family transporter [Oscillibacter sp.]